MPLPPDDYEYGLVQIVSADHGPYKFEVQLNGRSVAFTSSLESAQNIANQLDAIGFVED